MKRSIKLFGILIIGALSFNLCYAQTTKADKGAEINRIITSKNYVFKATYALPISLPSKPLTDDYDVAITKDSLAIYLPYFGRAYAAPMDETEGGIKLNTSQFSYNATENKKGGWDIIIKPKKPASSGAKDVQVLRLSVTADGYASLQVTSLNRQSISFNGNIGEIKKSK